MSDGTFGNNPPIPTSVLTKGEATTLALGTVIQDRYQIDRVVGLGGMGAVYRVRDLRFRDTIKWHALKEMIIKFADNFDQERRMKNFEREANLLASLDHPLIPKVHDFFAAANRAYLVLEYINGKDLEAVLSESTTFLPEQLVGSWAIQICDVLSYLHAYQPYPIVFRDLKPSNVMLTPENKTMLIDFGIAKIFQPDKRGTMIGTEGYSPPEQYRGFAEPGGDIYALGAMLHQLLTHSDPRLETPFTFHERPPRALNPGISPEMEAVIMKCLAYDIGQRWLTAHELKVALERVLRHRPGTGPLFGLPQLPGSPMPGGSAANGWEPHNRSLGTQTGTLPNATSAQPHETGLYTQAAGPRFDPTTPDQTSGQAPIQITTNLASRKQNAAPPASEKVAPTPSQLAQTYISPTPLWTFEAEEEVRSSPTLAHNTIFIGSYDHNLYALDALTGQFKWKFAAEEGICCTPACTGDVVIFGAEDYNVYAVNAHTGRQEWAYRTWNFVRSSPRIVHDQVFIGSDDGFVHALDLRSARTLWKFRTWRQVRSTPTYHQGLLFVGSNDERIYAIDVATGQEKWKYSTQHSIISSPAIGDGILYIGSMDNNIYAIESKPGWLAWKQRTNHFVTATPLVYDGRVFVGSMDGYFYCLDAQTGHIKWKYQAGEQITSSAAVFAGCVYFGCGDGAVYGLDARSGNLRWKFQTGGPVPSSPLIREGILYIGSNDHHIYALPCAK